ncbi:putative alpha alpha-trehalose-phosphate synthase [UDP-forming] 10 [Bienertia sinuspersici]
MASRSYTSFLDLAAGGYLDLPQAPRNLPKVMTVPGVLTDADNGDSKDAGSDASSSGNRERKIIVANFLPINAHKDPKSSKWSFTFDEDSLYLHLRDGFPPEAEVFYVGSLKVDVDVKDQEEVAQTLLEEFRCVPTFLPTDLQKKFYHGFCKQYLWPIFHYMLPMSPDHGTRFDRGLWQAYVSANKKFADKVVEILNPEDDLVWIHDYHLLLLPTFLRRRYYRVTLGFFLHSPFPSSEIYRTLPVRDEILKAFLNSDLIGFHTFDYARHFLSCCSRLLGLDYESKRGYLGIDYFGRTVYVKILPVGVQLRRLEVAMNHPSASTKVKEIQKQFEQKKVILGVDDMDIFKGISLKLLAVELLLHQYPGLLGKLVLVQIVNPARSTGKDVQEVKAETYEITKRINLKYGFPGYEPVILIDRPMSLFEKTAYYSIAECCIVNAVRDGLNLTPYKYIICRQGCQKIDEAMGVAAGTARSSMLVVSEFVGCSPSLSGAIRVNPWNIEAVADALKMAISMPDLEKQLRHEKHYRYVSSHDVAYWSRSFVQDLERACKDHYNKRCWGIGFGLSFRVLALSPSFRKLSVEYMVSAYKKTKKRAIFLDYDGTVVSDMSIVKSPSPELISVLNHLCDDPNNIVFIVSGRGRDPLGEWLSPCEKLGIAAEHGYFLRWNKKSDWEVSTVTADNDWKRIAEPVMQLYTEATDGSYIESKESAIVWHHQDADHDFASCQAKEMLDHLENVLANEPVAVTRGHNIVEVKPQGVSKGLVIERVLSELSNDGKLPDFLLCIGDDLSDENMFESILSKASCTSSGIAPEIFACTVGQKPSKAKYYLNDTKHVMRLLQGLASASCGKPEGILQTQVSFESSSPV